MRRFLDRLASLPILFIAGGCEASVVMVPCELPIVAMAPVHLAPHPVKHAHHVAHRGAHRRTPHSFHLVTAGALCPAWVGEGQTDGLANAFAHDFGDGSAFGGGGYGGGEGGEGGAGGFDGAGGFGGGGSDFSPFVLVDAPALPLLTPIIPPPDCCGPTPAPLPTPVPEPSTWILMLAGFAALALYRWRRAHV
jgi:hypothetical protein